MARPPGRVPSTHQLSQCSRIPAEHTTDCLALGSHLQNPKSHTARRFHTLEMQVLLRTALVIWVESFVFLPAHGERICLAFLLSSFFPSVELSQVEK